MQTSAGSDREAQSILVFALAKPTVGASCGFVLANRLAPSQTGSIMKRVPRIWKAFGPTAAIIIILTIQACAPFTYIGQTAFTLVISAPQQLAHGEAAFGKVLEKLKTHPGVSYDFHLVRNNGRSRDFRHTAKIAIKTDRVVTTELAKSLSQGEFTPIGSSITHHFNSPQAADIETVLDQIQK